MESQHGKELVRGAIYEFHKPDPGQRMHVEVVFMHGLQVNVADLKDAYYKTWRTADGKEVWLEKWLKEKYSNARILSLAYDSSARTTRAAGNLGPYLLGESLLDQMVSTAANIGQNDCPVVFVGHSLGGLIAKEIVVRCRNSDRANAKYQNLLRSLKAVFFYATPHGGSNLAGSWITKMARWLRVETSSLVEYLKPEGTDRTQIHRDFLRAVNKDCKFYVVAEGRETELIKGFRKSSAWIVSLNSASFPGPHEFLPLSYADHMTVCKPKSKNDTGYLKLIHCLDQVIGEYTRRIAVDLSVKPLGIQGKIDDISSLLERPKVSMVFLFGMGGVGKTTLSKAIYNLKAFQYEKSCYLENVKSKAVEVVQKELLRGLCGEKLDRDEDVGKQHLDMIKDCLLEQKVLVVIDDVSSQDCLRELQVFHALETGSHSKVVVTGRDSAILPKKHVNSGKVVIEPVNGIDLSVKPLGIQGKIDDISSLLERPKVSMVFLFGMGGVGKTTLSKAIYNLKAFQYEKSCYLENVKSKAVEVVQKELLRGLCGEKLDRDEDVGKQHLDMIKDCLLEQKVLVVIDDVSSQDCLRELQVFHALETGSHSKVVVTGRDSAILPKKHVNSGKVVIEPVNGITEGSDLELFLLYAFEAVDLIDIKEANIELLDEAKKIVQLCNGLPLSLEVLGKYLGNSKDMGKDLQQWKKIWVEAYDRLQKAQSIDGSMRDKLWSSLRISYDHLEPLEKQMFLDFACIFSEDEVEKRLIEHIWDSSIGVENLINKSLLKVQGDYFVMHDQLRDMGRYRLLKEALKDSQHPIYLLHGSASVSETFLEFEKLTESGVPYLASLEQEVGTNLHQYSKLRFFCVLECDTPSLVDDCLSQCSGDLRWLFLAYSGVTKIGIQKLCSLEGLRVLQIQACEDIVDIPEAIGNLTNLVELEVTECPNLQSLPDSFGNLKKLKRLEISFCGLRAVPNSVAGLSEVEYLSFGGCEHLTVIRGSQICTQKLVELKLPVMPTDCHRPFLELKQLFISNYDKGLTEFPQDFFKMDMPKLEFVLWMNVRGGEVLLKNPDGSQPVLNKGPSRSHLFEVRRHSNGSISQLRDPST